MRKPVHEASLNHVLKSEGGALGGAAPQSSIRPSLRIPTSSFSRRSYGERNGRSTGRRHRQLSLVPVGREVKPRRRLNQEGRRRREEPRIRT